MEPDPILQEVHARKLAVARDTHFDFDDLWQLVLKLEKENEKPPVRPPTGLQGQAAN